MVASQAGHQLLNLQRLLYEKAYADACAISSNNHSIISYSSRFEASLPEDFDKSDISDLVHSIKKQSLALYGDFHTLKQSQRGLVRLLRALLTGDKQPPIILALEAFEASHQKELDRYLAREISDSELLEATNYRHSWGFPWQHYKMLVDFARDFDIKVIGVNSHHTGKDTLSKRDKCAAQTLAKWRSEYPDHLMICMIGQYHLADQHLPAAIEEEFPKHDLPTHFTRVVTNIDRYFFKLSKGIHATTEYLKLKKNFYCIMNSPPWMKWQSYTIWEETRYQTEDLFIDPDEEYDEDDIHTEFSYDIDHHFLTMTKNLANFLGFDLVKQKVESFHICNAAFTDPFDYVDFGEDVTEREVEKFIERANLDGTYYSAHSNTVLLSRISINSLAEAAGQFFFHSQTHFDENTGLAWERFYRRTIKFAIGMISSKIFNPRRKCMTLYHYKRFISFNQKKRLIGFMRTKRETARAVLKHHEWMTKQDPGHLPRSQNMLASVYKLDHLTDYEISRSIGMMIGFFLYTKVMSNKIPSTTLKSIFQNKIKAPEELWSLIVDLYAHIEEKPA